MNAQTMKTEERGFPRFFTSREGFIDFTMFVRCDEVDGLRWTLIDKNGRETGVAGGQGVAAALQYVAGGGWIEVPREEAEAMIAKARGETGAQRASDHAERCDPGWQDRAFALLTRFSCAASAEFLGEHFRMYARSEGLEDPPDGRAFGAVFKRAARDGVIVAVGYAPANSSNRSPKTLWRRAS